jgi:hypothetical protein
LRDPLKSPRILKQFKGIPHRRENADSTKVGLACAANRKNPCKSDSPGQRKRPPFPAALVSCVAREDQRE